MAGSFDDIVFAAHKPVAIIHFISFGDIAGLGLLLRLLQRPYRSWFRGPPANGLLSNPLTGGAARGFLIPCLVVMTYRQEPELRYSPY
jgi:hypothetical protein